MKSNFIYKDQESALKRQRERALKRFNKMISKDAYFLTFTFNNKTLSNTTEQTRLRAVKKYLNEQASEYILNRDYGTENNREHYHAIAKPKYKIFIAKNYKYGFLKIRCLYSIKQFKATMKETTAERLYKHAIKESVKDNKIIYSRKLKTNKDFKYKALADNLINQFKEQPNTQKEIETALKIRANQSKPRH